MTDNNEIIYSEKIAHSELNNWKGFVLVVGIVFGVLALVLLVGFIEYLTGLNFLHFILLVALLISCFFIVKFFLTTYNYYILDDRFVITQNVGKREKVLAAVGFGEVVFIGKNDEKAQTYTVGRKKERATYKAICSKTGFIATHDEYILLDATQKFYDKIRENMAREEE